MVGRPGQHRAWRSLRSQIDATENLKYLGPLPVEQVNNLMSQADVFVNTSLYEGFPNTFIQAWSHGAVVASLTVDIDGGMEAQGVGYCAGSFDRLEKIIDTLVASPEQRQATAQRAFDYVQSRHSLANASTLADLIVTAGRVGRDSARNRLTLRRVRVSRSIRPYAFRRRFGRLERLRSRK